MNEAKDKVQRPDTINLTQDSYKVYLKIMNHRVISNQISDEKRRDQLHEDYKLHEIYRFNPDYDQLSKFLKEMDENQEGYLQKNTQKMRVPCFNENGNYKKLKPEENSIHKMHGTGSSKLPHDYFGIFVTKIQNANFHLVDVKEKNFH